MGDLKKFSFIDKEGKEIKCYKWESEGEAKGVIQISHGMTEYACRYDYVAKKFSENGFIVYAHDHRGHGETSKSEEERGYIADKEGFAEYGKDVAMQVAAANPSYLTEAEVPAEVLEKEKEILKVQAINEGKPEAIAEKMVQGRIKKFYKENCLIDQ